MNVGFVEARSFADFDCFIFHDVDMLPEDDRNFYVCSSQPRHVGSHISKWNYKFVDSSDVIRIWLRGTAVNSALNLFNLMSYCMNDRPNVCSKYP